MTDEIYTLIPSHTSAAFIELLHLLTDENILLTFKERNEVYKHINFLIEFLKDKKNGHNS